MNKMKIIYSILVLFTSVQLSFCQSVDFDLIAYKGLNFHATKLEIIEKFGNPEKTYDPNYACGFLSTQSQEGTYLTLDYGNVKYTGNEKDLYVLEWVDLENNGSIIINYGTENLSCETNLATLNELFGDAVAKHFGNELDGAIVIFNQKGEDGIRLHIKNGKLIEFEYWSPC